MPPVTCPNGHQWTVPADRLASATTLSLACPVCGAILAPSPTLSGADSCLTRAAPEPPPQMPPAERIQLPGYEILDELGRGGMGVVYKARHIKLHRLVALKMILAGAHADAADLERFRTEGKAIAALQHPNIVQIHEVGEHAGLPFFSLEFCPGGSLDKKMDGTPLPPAEAAALVERLAEAVAAAHAKGVIHRDLKPANVLLAEDGTPKLTDFGLARKLDEVGQTQTGAVLGTPSYMAPEQAHGNKRELGHASDVYGLGAVLYACLTGRPPFRATTTYATLAQVMVQEVVSPRTLNAQVPVDLETICLKCLRKEASKRYATAEELAADLGRFRAGEPIRARPVGAMERLGKWGKRRPAIAALSATLVAVVVVAFVLVLAALQGEQGQRLLAQNKAQAEADARTLAHKERLRAEKGEADAKKERDLAERGRKETKKQLERARGHLFTAQLIRVASALGAEEYDKGYALLHDCNACPIDLRDFAWRFYARQCKRDRLTLLGHTGRVRAVAFSVDGKTLASASGEYDDKTREGWGELKLWDVATGKERASLKGHTEEVMSLAFSSDGKMLASGGRGYDPKNRERCGELKLWDVATGQQRASFKGHTESVMSVAFSPDGKTLASGSGDKTVKLWDVATGQECASLMGHTGWVNSVAFGRDGKTLASGSNDKTVKLWDVATGQQRASLKGHTESVSSVAFSPDGKTLASGGWDKRVKLWDVATGQERPVVMGHSQVMSVAFTPDGKTLAFGSLDGTVKLCDPATGEQWVSLTGHTHDVASVAFSPDGKTLASGSGDRTVKLWDVATGQERASLKGHTGPVTSVAFSPDGKTLASSSGWGKRVGELRLWDAATGQERTSLQGPAKSVYSVAFSPDDKMLASGSEDGTVKLWDVATGQQRASFSHAGLASVAFSVDGKTLASGYLREVKLWDVATGQVRASLKGHTSSVRAVAFSPDGKMLASAGKGYDPKTEEGWGELKLWDVATGQERASLKGHTEEVTAVAFSPDGKTLASGSGEFKKRGAVKLWDVATGQERASFKGYTEGVRSVAFSPDSKTLASGSWDKTVKLWDVATGQQRASFKGHTESVKSVAFSPDGKTLASGSLDQTVKLWDVATGQECASLMGHTGWVNSVAFGRDGKTLASGCSHGTVKLWDVATGQERPFLKGHSQGVRAVAFSPDGKTLASGSNDKTVKLWDVVTSQERASLKGHTLDVSSVVFSPDGKTLASASGGVDPKTGKWWGELKLWDVVTGQERPFLKNRTAWVDSLAFSPDGKTLAFANRGYDPKTRKEWGELKLWDVATGKERTSLKGHTKEVWSVAFSADGKTLASGSEDKTVKLWDVATGQERASLKGHTGPVMSVAFSPDSKTLASGSGDKTVKLWDVATGQQPASLMGHTERATAVAFSPDGKTLASGSEDRTVKLWDVAMGQQPASLMGHTERATAVAFSPDGKTLASGSEDRTVKLWDVATGQERPFLKGHSQGVRAVAFSPDGKTLASGSNDKTVKLWDVVTSQERASLKGHTLDVSSVVFSPDGKTLASASGGVDPKTGKWWGELKLWDVATGQERPFLKGRTAWVDSLAFSPDGKTLAFANRGYDPKTRKEWGELKLWDVATGKERTSLKGRTAWVGSTAFSPDGKTLPSSSENGFGADNDNIGFSELKLWDVATGQQRASLKGHTQSVTSVAFSADGKMLASGAAGSSEFRRRTGWGEVKVWNVATGQQRAFLTSHTGGVMSVAFSPDGKMLASGSVDGTVKLWNVATALREANAGR